MAFSRTEKITIGSAIIGSPLITIIFDYLRSVPVFSTLKTVLTWTLDIFISIATFSIQLWIIVLVFVGLIVLLVIWSNRIEKAKRLKTPSFNFLTYTEDIIDGFRWTWKYQHNPATNQQMISDRKAYCPKCNSILRGNNDWLANTTSCIRCNYSIQKNIYNDLNKIDLLIIDNIERKQRNEIQINL